MQDIKNYFDKYIMYDEQNDQIITTYGEKVGVLPLNQNNILINDSIVNVISGAIKEDEQYYLPISAMSKVYNVDIDYIDEKQILLLDSLDKELIKADEILQGNYGWLASTVLWKDGRECKMNRPKLKKSFYDYLEYMKYGIVQAEQATFVSVFFKSEIVEKVGLPIKDFFIWGDDIEYTRRISVRNGLPCFVAGKSQVIHAMCENNGSNIATDVPERIDRYKYAFRNEGYLYRQEGCKGIAYYFAKCVWTFLKILLYAPDKKLRRNIVLLSSVLKGLVFSPKVELVLGKEVKK